MQGNEQHCFHCGLDLPPQPWRLEHAGQWRSFCCAGCMTVARTILEGGLQAYYQRREGYDAAPTAPDASGGASADDSGWAVYDDEQLQQDFVTHQGKLRGELRGGLRQASLILEGIHCSACIWLNEQHVARLRGVQSFTVNHVTHRAQLRWDPSQLRLSQVLQAIAAIGYRALPFDPGRAEQSRLRQRRAMLWRLFVAGFSMMQVMMLSLPVYLSDGASDMTPDIVQLMRIIGLMLTLPVMLFSASPFLRSAWRDLRLRRVGMDVPVSIGILVAFFASLWATLRAEGDVWFDSISMFVFLLLAARWLELLARERASRHVESLATAQPDSAQLLAQWPQRTAPQRVLARSLRPGAYVLIAAGERVPADGVVVQGEGSQDEALLSGESRPVSKQPGSLVIAGALNLDQTLVVQVQQVGADSRLSCILRLAERAAQQRPAVVTLADRYASHLLGAVLLLALASAAAWLWIDPAHPARALLAAVAVLVVTCPCALSLAAPMAFAATTAALAARGVLITRSSAIETLARVTHLAMDKTGTLTEGVLRLQQVQCLRPSAAALTEQALLQRAASIGNGSLHPVARALCDAAGSALLPVEGLQEQSGQGVQAVIAGRTHRLGRLDWALALSGVTPPRPSALHQTADDPGQAGSLAALTDDEGLLALFHFSDPLRAGAKPLLQSLQQQGIALSLLSGDHAAAVQAVALELGLVDGAAPIHHSLLPQDKQELVRQLQQRGAVVAMLGDGVNDVPVLAGAQVSIAVVPASSAVNAVANNALAQSAADVVLLGGDLPALDEAFTQARRCMRVVRQNLIWSFGYNLAAIPAAALGLVPPWLAGAGMAVSSVAVVANAARLLPARRPERRPVWQPERQPEHRHG
jgi:Cu2+-exporting ATPase